VDAYAEKQAGSGEVCAASSLYQAQVSKIE